MALSVAHRWLVTLAKRLERAHPDSKLGAQIESFTLQLINISFGGATFYPLILNCTLVIK